MKIINTSIKLTPSKSISNRLLILQFLSNNQFNISNLSDSNDTKSLIQILDSYKKKSELNVGLAGTTARFITAFLSMQKEGSWLLTGEQRIKERPIKPLVDALISIGADIKYVEKNGFLPLKIKARKITKNIVKLPANISSQFISALLLIAPFLENGLEINLLGNIVSSSYINMTLQLLSRLGFNYSQDKNTIKIKK